MQNISCQRLTERFCELQCQAQHDLCENKMDNREFDTLLKLWGIFMPYAMGKRKKLGRVLHYTSAENAIKIIASRTMWLGNTQCMSDYSEVQHGYEMLWQYFNDPKKAKVILRSVS